MEHFLVGKRAAIIRTPAGSPVYSFGLVGLGVAWLTTTIIGYRYVVVGNISEHRAWMIRSFIVTFGFVSLRVIVAIIAGLGLMGQEDANSPAAWRCWILPLTVFEVAFRRRYGS